LIAAQRTIISSTPMGRPVDEHQHDQQCGSDEDRALMLPTPGLRSFQAIARNPSFRNSFQPFRAGKSPP
jgi:hypothetical protein